MAAYDITAPDGKTYRLEGPEGATKVDLINALAAKFPTAVQTTEELEAAPRAPFSAGNIFKGLSSAVLGGTKSLVDVTGAGTGISKSLGEASQFLESKMTPERQEEMQRRQELIDRANRSGSLLKEAKAYLGGVFEAPLESTVRGVGSSAPSIVAGLAALPLEAPAALAIGVTAISRMAVGAAQGVGEYKGSVFDAVKEEYIKKGYSEKDAEQLAVKAQEYSADKAMELGGSALLGALDAYTGIEAAATGAFKKVAKPTSQQGLAQAYKSLPTNAKPLTAPNIFGSMAGSVAGEAPLEGLQGGFGQYAQNLALSKEGFEKAPLEGVLGSSLRDAAVGALTGGVFTPLNHVQRSRDFALDQYLRTQGPIAVANEERAARRKEIEEQQAKTKEQLGIKAPPLMLEGPKDKLFKPDEEILRDPVGRITRDELGNALQDKAVAEQVTSYIDSYRKENNLPPLQNFSLEDIKDAMTAMAPEGELGALQSIIAYKTGFNNEAISADDVLHAAEAKEIATGTQGFKDFLERATGSSDLDTMSDVQRFSAFKALSSLNKRETGRETVLRPGTNASRFTQDQFNEGLTTLAKYIEQENGKLAMPEAIEIIKAQTSLKTDRDAYTLLNSAAAQNMLNLDKGEVFNVVDRNGNILSTHTTEERAKEFARKRDTIEKQAGEYVSIAEEPKAKAPLPKGYAVTKQTVEGEETPAGYAVSAPDSGKPLTIVEQIEDLQAKVEQMEGARRAEADKELAGALRIQQALQQRKDNLTRMEALGQTDTVEYKKAKSQQTIAEREFSKRIQSLLDRAERLKAPLKTKPVGRNVQPKDVYTLTKDGKTVGKFKSEDEAYASMFLTPETEGGLSDKELEDIAVKGGNLGNRAQKALEDRQTKGFKIETTPESRTKAEFKAKADEIGKILVPMLRRFGLGNVGLNIVSAIKNGAEGSYENSLIEIAIGTKKFVETLRHESIHALKELGFFTDAQWKALERQADKEWINKYLKGKKYGDKGMTRYDAYYNMFKEKGYNPAQIDEAIREEAIADAFGDFSKTKPPAGMIASLLARLNNFFTALRNALNGAGFNTAEDIFEQIEAGELKPTAPKGVPSNTNAWKATPEDEDKAEKYSIENGILPYTSSGFLNLPISGKKYSIQKFNPEKHLRYDTSLEMPINKDGTVTLYYHTTKENALKIGSTKVIPSEGRNRVYLTNESVGADILRDKGNFDQELDGSTVLVYVDPESIQMDDTQYTNGRKDFFIPLAQGDFFNRKMKLQSIQKGRQEAITEVFSYKEHEDRIASAVQAYKNASSAERKKLVASARKLLKKEHNVSTLLTENGKLEKTRVGDYNLNWEGNSVASMGLGLASAQKISDKVSTCPRSAICEGLCLGETSGGNLMFGGAASEDVGEISRSSFRAAARMMQYLKTEALIIHPEEFATVLQAEIDSLAKWCASETQVKINKETKKRENIAKEIYQPAVRLNVTSDFKPSMFSAIITGNPDIRFYDYTKLGSESIAPNHHLTYSSTGFGQIVDGKKVFFKDKAGRYDHNWATMRERLNNGQNVAMAFSSKTGIPSFLMDEETGVQYKVWNGDDYDARFLDPVQPDGKGMIIGLKNKAGTLSEKNATQKTGGFFVQYDPKTDGDTVVVPKQSQFKGLKDIGVETKKFSLGNIDNFFDKAEKIPEPKGVEIIRDNWIGGVSGVGERDSAYDLYRVNGGKKYMQDVQDLVRKEFGETFKGYRLMHVDELEEIQTGAMGNQLASFTLRPDIAQSFANLATYRKVPKDKLKVVEMDLTPEHVWMIGHPAERELVIDYGQGYNADKVVEYQKKFSLTAPDTPAFKRWFEGSKVVDEDGKPLVVYHGTGENFSVFEYNKFKSLGTWFAKQPELASQYSELVARQGKPPSVMPVYLSIKNPATEEDLDEATKLAETEKGRDWSKINKRRREILQAQGFDGVILSDAYVVFEPNQIKSATGNIGTFDVNNPDIRYSLGTYFPTAKAAEDAAYAKGPPQTHEFKVFFGASKAMEEGRAQPMFHASTEEFDIFRENKPIFVSPEARFAEDFIKRRIKEAKSLQYLSEDKEREAKIYPLWVRAETPFDYENEDHVRMVMDYLKANHLVSQNLEALKKFYPNTEPTLKIALASNAHEKVDKVEESLTRGDWRITEDAVVQAALKTLGFDSFHIKEDNIKQLAVFKANQVKSITGNIGEFNPENKSIKYSLPTISAAAQKRVNEATTVSEPKTTFERITEAVFPRSFSYFRQEAINRYNQLSVYDKTLADQMGGKDLLASVSAEQGALFSDLDSGVLASVMGVGNRQGGVPVYRNGITTIDTSVKGLTALFAPLAKYHDPVVFQHYQFWAAVKRGLRLIDNGKERNIQASDKIIADEFAAKYPEFEQVQKDWITFNNGMVKYLVDTNVLSQERANEYMKYADYIPFYRQLDGRDTVGPKVFQSLTTVKPPREIHGSDAPLADFLETVVRNTHASIRAGMKNSAALKAVNVATQVKAAGMGAEKVVDANGNPVVSQSPDTFTVFEKGEKVSYRTPDALLISSLTSLNMPELPFMGLISAPANALRNLVTKDPGFMMVNLMRDSLSAYVTSGVNILPIAGSAQQFVKGLMKQSPAMEAILNAGIGGGYEFSQNIERSGANLYADLQKKAGNGPKGLKGIATSLWDALETGTTASDMATRALIYERVMKETGDEAEALKRALEVMNFNRKGRSAVVRILTAAVPFLNARIQGLDVFFRAGISPTYRSLRGLPVTDQEKAVMRRFWIRGSTMMALSVMYYFAVSDDDEYKKQEQETKDNYWIVPSTSIKIATPFEVGTLFKTIPERIAAYLSGNDTGEDFRSAMFRAFNNTIPVSPTAYIPQVFKPMLEYSTNFNFFTMRPIVGQGMEGVDAKYQVGPSTSLTFQELGKMLGVSPLKAEQMYKGYTGTMGMYLVDVMDTIMQTSGSNPQASKRFEQLPIIKRFALDPEARGSVTQYYELRNSVHTAVATANMLERTDPQEFASYLKENAALLANKDYVNDMYKTLKQYNDMRKMVNTSPMSGDEKRAVLTNINHAEQNLTKNIQLVKKAIASVQ